MSRHNPLSPYDSTLGSGRLICTWRALLLGAAAVGLEMRKLAWFCCEARGEVW